MEELLPRLKLVVAVLGGHSVQTAAQLLAEAGRGMDEAARRRRRQPGRDLPRDDERRAGVAGARLQGRRPLDEACRGET